MFPDEDEEAGPPGDDDDDDEDEEDEDDEGDEDEVGLSYLMKDGIQVSVCVCVWCVQPAFCCCCST